MAINNTTVEVMPTHLNCSFYGAIHSATHPRPATASSPAHTLPAQVKTQSSSGVGARLAAVIRGHLCRRLLSTCKVQSIVKTIHDCRSLLPQYRLAEGEPLMSVQDINFQQRLIDQVSICVYR